MEAVRKIRHLCFLIVLLALLEGCGKPAWRPEPAAPSQTLREDVVRTARTQLGMRYRYGGCSTETGFDCSGFVQWVFHWHGVQLPRETRRQWESGFRIPADTVMAGDLVFFGNPSEGPTHVGISTGPDRFIHCPSTGGRVREDRLSGRPWRNTVMGGCRVLP